MKRIRKISCFIFAVFIISMFALQINAVEARVMPVQVRMLSGETYVYQPYGCAYVQTELVLTGDAQNGAVISIGSAGCTGSIRHDDGFVSASCGSASTSIDYANKTITVTYTLWLTTSNGTDTYTGVPPIVEGFYYAGRF